MNKTERINQLEKQISQLEKLKEDLAILRTKEEIFASDLIRDYETDKPVYLTKEITEEKYAFQLGGDGRSCPSEEWRLGQVLTVKINNDYYVSTDDLRKLKRYIDSTTSVDHVIIAL